jgi:predicted transcriptional regulator
MTKVLLISVKPEFAQKIFEGSKKIELRKCAPSVSIGDLVIVYSTLPEKAVLGTCVVAGVIKNSPTQLWRKYSSELGIDRKRYFEYFKNSETAVGIILTSIQKFEKKIHLHQIKKDYPMFSPPQTFKYFSKGQFDVALRKITRA